MCKVQMLRALVKQRLTAAAQEIFGLFERTIAEYEEELSASRDENERQRRLLDAVFNPEVRVHRADVQQLFAVKDALQQQVWSSSLDQEDPEPPHIKEDYGELWTSQQEGLEEAGIKFSFTPVKSKVDEEEAQSSQLHQRLTEHMGTEDDEDCGGPEADWFSDPESDTDEETGDSSEPDTDDSVDLRETREPQSGSISLNKEEAQSSPLHQRQTELMETEADGEDCGGPEPDMESDPERHPEPDTDEETRDSSDLDGCDDLKETREPLSGLNSVSNEVYVSGSKCSTGEKPLSCSKCGERFYLKGDLKKHKRIHTREKPFSCSECDKSFTVSGSLKRHMITHTGEKPFSAVCKKTFRRRGNLKTHTIVHTGEKPLSCFVCKKTYTHRAHLQTHTVTHTGEKPVSCSVCDKSFTHRGQLKRHMRIHTGEKPFSCSVCGRAFTESGNLKKHMRIHTREKPFSCSVCDESFSQSGQLKRHRRRHTEENSL
ncbi:zinc finger protein 84-like isoform X1 [Clinocottus analis]|uniref:zinc finger protein 84-like isoform X1 n=2 Tax=Clinocottus analis TaxID=304258 RepID=UPI0035BF26A0